MRNNPTFTQDSQQYVMEVVQTAFKMGDVNKAIEYISQQENELKKKGESVQKEI